VLVGFTATAGGIGWSCKRIPGSQYQLEGILSRFESATPDIEGTIWLGAAVGFLESVRMDEIRQHSLELGKRLVKGLKSVPGLKVYPESTRDRIGIAAFVLPGIPADDLSRALCDTLAS